MAACGWLLLEVNMKKIVFETEIAGYPIRLIDSRGEKLGDGPFEVHYGQQTKRGLTYVKAAHKLGECLLHALSCAGRLDFDLDEID